VWSAYLLRLIYALADVGAVTESSLEWTEYKSYRSHSHRRKTETFSVTVGLSRCASAGIDSLNPSTHALVTPADVWIIQLITFTYLFVTSSVKGSNERRRF